MEFTEVEELNAIAMHARSFLPGQLPGQLLTVTNPSFSTYRKSSGQPETINIIFDYEKALKDTPPSTPSKNPPPANIQIPAILAEDKEETLEDIVKTINVSLALQEDINDSPIGFFKRDAINQPTIKITEEEKPEKKEEEQKLGDLQDNNGYQFEKIGEEYVSKSYREAKNTKSFLSSSIKAFPMSKDYSTARRAEIKTFKVQFLNENFVTLIPISLSISVAEIIKQCLDMFKLNKAIGPDVMKYPDRPDAYQLKRDASSESLDRQKTLKDFKIGRELIIVETKNFDVSKPYSEASQQQNGQEGAEKNYVLTITLHFPTEDHSRIVIQMGSERQVKDIFSRLALEGKSGFNMQTYNLKVYVSDPETRWKESKNFLDASMPLKNIKFSEQDGFQLELVKKKFADEPTEPIVDHRTSSPKKRAGTVDITNEQSDQIILYNDVSANHYEEFEVIKINDNGKRQERILGIDGFKLYNYSRSYKQEQSGRIGDMFNTIFFSRFGTMNPERLITDVTDIKLMGNKEFLIGVNSEGRTKWLRYEAVESKVANQIAAKINYLKALQAKKNM